MVCLPPRLNMSSQTLLSAESGWIDNIIYISSQRCANSGSKTDDTAARRSSGSRSTVAVLRPSLCSSAVSRSWILSPRAVSGRSIDCKCVSCIKPPPSNHLKEQLRITAQCSVQLLAAGLYLYIYSLSVYIETHIFSGHCKHSEHSIKPPCANDDLVYI